MASATTGEAGGGAGAGPGGGRGGCEAPEHGPPPRASSRPRSILGALRTGAGVRASALDAAAEALAHRLPPASSPEGSGRGGGGVGSPGPSPSLYAHVLSTSAPLATPRSSHDRATTNSSVSPGTSPISLELYGSTIDSNPDLLARSLDHLDLSLVEPRRRSFEAPRPQDQIALHRQASQSRQRRAVAELLFRASKGDLRACKKLLRDEGIDVRTCSDYDLRTPLHLAAAEGAVSVTQFLLANGADVNAVDRFRNTPLDEALRGGFMVVAGLISQAGGKVYEGDTLLGFRNSSYVALSSMATTSPPPSPGRPSRAGAGAGTTAAPAAPAGVYDAEHWEIDPEEVAFGEKIGEGEFGVVYRATWRGTPVAAKVLKSSEADFKVAELEFRQEVATMASLSHPHVLQFLGASTRRMPFMIVTELAVGALDGLARLQIQPGLGRTIELALQAAYGLGYMHERKPFPVVHRDLKPANLMIVGGGDACRGRRSEALLNYGVLKIADFGLSKTLDSLTNGKHAARHADFLPTGETGTYRYMAPEVYKHEYYDHKVDVYSYGIILYQLFEKKPAYEGLDPLQTARAAATEGMRPAFHRSAGQKNKFHTPEPIRKLIADCWQSDPNLRPEFRDIIARLTAFRDERAAAARSSSKAKGLLTSMFGLGSG